MPAKHAVAPGAGERDLRPLASDPMVFLLRFSDRGAEQTKPAVFKTLKGAKDHAQATVADLPADDDDERKITLRWEEVSVGDLGGRQWQARAGGRAVTIDEIRFHDV